MLVINSQNVHWYQALIQDLFLGLYGDKIFPLAQLETVQLHHH